MRRLRLSEDSGFTLIEVLVASVVLIIGVLGTFMLVTMSSAGANRARVREGATNLAREVLEDAHDIQYSQIGQAKLTPYFNGLSGLVGNVALPASNSIQATVARRGVTYTVTTSWCSVDDSKDQLGVHAGTTTWCGGGAGGGPDPQPEDLKRVTTQISYSTRGVAQPPITQVATFGAGGAGVGPSVQTLAMTSPTPTPPAAPVITTNVSTATFRASAPGAADVRFTVNGVEVTSGVTASGTGTWDYTWPISTLTDATYQIGAVAIDALGVRGQPQTIPVKLARAAAIAPANVTGGYNKVAGITANPYVVELAWDANPEGSVTGYQVYNPSGTSVCGGQTSLAITCLDPSPPTTGSGLAYTVKTWYRDGAGTLQSATTTKSVTPPTPATTVPTVYGYVNSTGNVSNPISCASGQGVGSGSVSPKRDLVSNFPTTGGTDSTAAPSPVGCGTPFTTTATMAAGTATFSGWFTNTSTKSSCSVTWFLYKNSTYIGTTTAFISIPANTTTPIQGSSNQSYSAQTFAVGDTLNMYANVCTTAGSTMTYGSGAHQAKLTVPTLTGGSAGSTVPTPSPPTTVGGYHNADGTSTLTFTAPTSSSPAVDFYRIYRDGQAYSNRIDSTDAVTSTSTAATAVSASSITVADATGFASGQALSVDSGANQDNVTIGSISGNTITFTSSMPRAHASGTPVRLRSVTWTDTNVGNVTHSYWVTSVSSDLSESTSVAAAPASF